MTYSIAFYDWVNIAHQTDTSAGLERILSEAKAELTPEEYEALIRVLALNEAKKKMLDMLGLDTLRYI